MRIGYVLTGGSLKGICAQIGAIQALEQFGYYPECIFGTSAGSIVGAMYASGMSPEEMEHAITSMRKKDYLDPGWLDLLKIILRLGEGWTGLCKGRALLKYLNKTLPVQTFLRTQIPLNIVATNISTGRPHVFSADPLRLDDDPLAQGVTIPEAARASSCIPVVFQPQKIGEQYFVDGGAVNNVALDEMVDKYPDLDMYVIISSLSVYPKEAKIDNEFLEKPFSVLGLLEKTLKAAKHELYKENLEAPGKDVRLLRVNPGSIHLDEIDKSGKAIEKAYVDAYHQLREGLLT